MKNLERLRDFERLKDFIGRHQMNNIFIRKPQKETRNRKEQREMI